MNQKDVDLMLAKAQIVMAFCFMVLIFALIFVLLILPDRLTGTALTIVTSVIAALVTVLTLQQNFFFARTRPPALPDPTTVSSTSVISSGPNPPTPQTPSPTPSTGDTDATIENFVGSGSSKPGAAV